MSFYDRMLPSLNRDGTVVFDLVRDRPVSAGRRLGARGRKSAVSQITGKVQFRFDRSMDRGARRLKRVSLEIADGMTGTDLRRFPWATLTTAAEALDQRLYKPERGGRPIDALEKVHKRHGGKTERRTSVGRRGLGQRFYKEAGERFLELRAAGERAPIKVIARERLASPDTVKTWIRKARQLGYIPKGRS